MQRFVCGLRLCCAASLLVACLLASTAQGVALSMANDSASLRAPGNDPGWNNVARLSGASAVYLGDRWMITANHVSQTAVTFSDGRSFDVSVDSGVVLSNTGAQAATSADLRMFRLAEDPGLPSLAVATAPPADNSTVTMIGAGRDKVPQIVGWQVTSGSTGPVWTKVPLLRASAIGFDLLDSSHMRWGVNQVVAGSSAFTNNTVEYALRFDRPGIPFEAQAVLGDSGGGVFEFVGGAWKLTGIMDAQDTLSGQPAQTAVFGNASLVADLSAYRDQIESLLSQPDRPWQNQFNRYDVDRSGKLTAHDALLVINKMQGTIGPVPLAGTPGATDPMLDINGDGFLSGLDALQIINKLLFGTPTRTIPFSATNNVALIPEPSGGVLAASGALVLALVRGAAILRRRKRTA